MPESQYPGTSPGCDFLLTFKLEGAGAAVLRSVVSSLMKLVVPPQTQHSHRVLLLQQHQEGIWTWELWLPAWPVLTLPFPKCLLSVVQEMVEMGRSALV